MWFWFVCHMPARSYHAVLSSSQPPPCAGPIPDHPHAQRATLGRGRPRTRLYASVESGARVAAKISKWGSFDQASRSPITYRRRLARLTATLRRFGFSAAHALARGSVRVSTEDQDHYVSLPALRGVDRSRGYALIGLRVLSDLGCHVPERSYQEYLFEVRHLVAQAVQQLL